MTQRAPSSTFDAGHARHAPSLAEGEIQKQRLPHLVTDGSTALVAGYVYVLGMPLLRYDSAGAPVYYLEDGLGSIAALADGTGAAVARFDYDGFGNLRPGSSPVDDSAGGDFGFHGTWLDTMLSIGSFAARSGSLPQAGRPWNPTTPPIVSSWIGSMILSAASCTKEPTVTTR